jgi:GNAT superfamily N-acetyltransferase
MTTIRRATYQDADVISQLLGQLGYPAGAADIDRRLRLLDKSDNAILVAEANGKVVGVTALHRMNVLHAALPVGYIIAFVVAEGARGAGAGRTLLSAAEQWARDAGCDKLTVTSAEHRDDAHKFYPACGMPYSGRRFSKSLSAK